MVAVLSVIKGKNKVIVSGLAGALSTLVFLTMIHIAAKIAIIVAAATVTYTLLSLTHKVAAKFAKTAETSKDERYNSVGKGEEKDTVEEPEKTKAELEEELKNKRAEEEMKNGLPKHMDFKGNSLAGADGTSQTEYATNYMDLMRSPPMHMNGCYQEIEKGTDIPRTVIHMEPGNKSTQKLSAAEWLSRYGSITNNSMRMPERLTMEDIINQRG